PQVVDDALRGIKEPHRKVLHYDRTQPEKRLTFLKYRNTRASAYRIKLGQSELKKHQAILEKVSRHYGVSECFIVSLWGLETSYGRFMGSFPVIHSLATLAYDNRRAKFFRKQLFYALHILNDGHVQLSDFKGEWAGASGHPQFLPSSWHHYAVDFNGDGRKDIWKSLPDVFASIANYLHKNGWKPNEPWMIPVSIPASFDKDLLTRKVTKSIKEWEALGVRPAAGETLPSGNYQVSIIQPYGGPTMMIFNNFKVIMKWNRSTYYAGTVGYMAEKVCKRPIR
ncbi:MAG: lytic murein transglycosylase, partial [Coxiellaceae bacterium]|nr:lytic murein transglycosylase [Coxiellaceae bacterium]